MTEAPSTARMIDFWLGGAHHRPVDVAAARAFERAFGTAAPDFVALRGFLRRVVRTVAAKGVDEFLVIGAGVPTQGNVHEVAREARVLYTDVDRETVALGEQIVAGQDRVSYAYGDATDLSTIDAKHLPGWGIRPTGVVFLGLAAFLDDAALAAAFESLYEAVAPGSYLAFDFDSEVLASKPVALEMMGPAFHMRRSEGFAPLLGRWALTPAGIAPVERWGRPRGNDDEAPLWGAEGARPASFYGGLAVKEAIKEA